STAIHGTHTISLHDALPILEGLDAVRKRPAMYIGSTDIKGLHHLAYEIIDNAVDEALSGYCDEIKVTLHADDSISIEDNGRGIPVGMHQSGVPTLEVIMTVLHAGGKFGQGGYQASGGLHGVGSSVVNALSEWLDVTVYREGYEYFQRFEHGGKPVTSLEKKGKTNKVGTLIRFKADESIFSTTTFNFEILSERLREAAFLLADLKIQIKDERTDTLEVYEYEDGLKAFINYLNEGKDGLHDVISFTGKNDLEVDFAFQFNDGYAENMHSFVNHVRTKDGGTHEIGARTAITRTFNDYAKRHGILKENDKNIEGKDIREGLTAVVSVRIPEELLQFEGQTKGRLGSPEARSTVDSIISEKLNYFLEENNEVATQLLKKAIRAREAREAAQKAREEARS